MQYVLTPIWDSGSTRYLTAYLLRLAGKADKGWIGDQRIVFRLQRQGLNILGSRRSAYYYLEVTYARASVHEILGLFYVFAIQEAL